MRKRKDCERGGPSAGNIDTSDGEDEEEKEEQGKRIEVVVSSGEESSKSDEQEDEEGTMNRNNEKEGSIAGKEDEKDDKEGGMEVDMELDMEKGGMGVDASIEKEAQTSRHGETAGAGAECQVPQQVPANQTSPLERTLTSMTPAEDEGQGLQRQHTSAWSARQAHNPEAEIQRMSQFFNRKR